MTRDRSFAVTVTPTTGPPCAVCRRPMLVGQQYVGGRDRHLSCSPRSTCCGWPIDLIPDLNKHRRDCGDQPERTTTNAERPR